MKELEEGVRAIEKDGLVWGLSKLVAVGYGVSKLQITVVIEDEKISLDDLQVHFPASDSEFGLRRAKADHEHACLLPKLG